MLRLTLIGPGDIDFHYYKLLGLKESEFQSELEKIAKALSESEVGLELLPDKGVSIEIAKLYKQRGGKEVIGTVPKSDKTFGIKHLQPYINTKVKGKKLFDKIINSGDWFKHDLIKGLLGDAVLYLGSSPGTEGELNYATYLFKLIQGMKKYVETPAEKIHPEIRANKNIPYTYFIYSPFIKTGKLSKETEAYLEKIGIKLEYIKNPNKLKEKLQNL
ncbi:hypothetical protein KAJ87_04180 [Candidatus Pacearchaeota archaeon]|nr:hypothetical protein [Candidatus Pacearchaeota archaeon]